MLRSEAIKFASSFAWFQLDCIENYRIRKHFNILFTPAEDDFLKKKYDIFRLIKNVEKTFKHFKKIVIIKDEFCFKISVPDNNESINNIYIII